MLITSQRISERAEDWNMASILTAPQYLLPGESLMMECWTCMKRREVDARPYYAGKPFKLPEVARANGWIAATDFRRQRTLAFCSEGCEMKAKTKDGMFKATRPRG